MIIVVGGGASGLAAAIAASEHGGEVMLLERGKRVGQKLALTGNGRCNFTNLSQKESDYRGDDPSFGFDAVNAFTPQDACGLFGKAGIFVKEKQGYCYPLSEQAQTVSELLGQECYRLGVQMQFGCMVTSVKRDGIGYIITAMQQDKKKIWRADYVILACGGMTFPKTGSDGMGYEFAKKLGHTIKPLMPALCGLECELPGKNFFSAVAGVRTNVRVTVCDSKGVFRSECGELQLTGYGISGIPVFCVSRYAAEWILKKRTVEIVLDFLPDIKGGELTAYLLKEKAGKENFSLAKILWGMLNQKLTSALLNFCGIADKKMKLVSEEELALLAGCVKQFTVMVKDFHEPSQAQVTAGGINTAEIDRLTMESKLSSGLYICGEMLDVDGTCGGYNLQFAWASGYLAGKAAAEADVH